MSVKKKSRKGKGSYAAYKSNGTFEKNQARKRAKHVKAHPNDEQSVKLATPGYKRKKPMKPNSTVSRPKYYDDAGRRIAPPSFDKVSA